MPKTNLRPLPWWTRITSRHAWAWRKLRFNHLILPEPCRILRRWRRAIQRIALHYACSFAPIMGSGGNPTRNERKREYQRRIRNSLTVLYIQAQQDGDRA